MKTQKNDKKDTYFSPINYFSVAYSQYRIFALGELGKRNKLQTLRALTRDCKSWFDFSYALAWTEIGKASSVASALLFMRCTRKSKKLINNLPFLSFIIYFFAEFEIEKASLENMPANLYESVCVPDLGDFLGYQQQQANAANNSVSTPEHKSPATPASSTTSTTSSSGAGPRNSSAQSSIQQPLSSGSAPLQPRSYHNDGEYSYFNVYIFFWLNLVIKLSKRLEVLTN